MAKIANDFNASDAPVAASQPGSSPDEMAALRAELAELKAGIKDLSSVQKDKATVAKRRAADETNKYSAAVETLFDFFKAELVKDTPLAALGVAIGAGLATKALLSRSATQHKSSDSVDLDD